MIRNVFLYIFILLSTFLSAQEKKGIIETADGSFKRNSEVYFPVGVNTNIFLTSDDQNISNSLDFLQSTGIDHIKIATDTKFSFSSELQDTVITITSDELFKRLDFCIFELSKRGMNCTICLKHWDGQCSYKECIDKIISRTNTISNIPYNQESAIMSWEIDVLAKDLNVQTVNDIASFIIDKDENHLITLSCDRLFGKNENTLLYEQLFATPHIDYLTLPLLPRKWEWSLKHSLWEDLLHVYQLSNNFIQKYNRLARKLEKPLIIEDSAYPRDGEETLSQCPTQCRDAFFSYIFSQYLKSVNEGNYLAGGNFSHWVGNESNESPSYPLDTYSIFQSDSTTLNLIHNKIKEIHQSLQQ